MAAGQNLESQRCSVHGIGISGHVPLTNPNRNYGSQGRNHDVEIGGAWSENRGAYAPFPLGPTLGQIA
jgi:hypothetical protein